MVRQMSFNIISDKQINALYATFFLSIISLNAFSLRSRDQYLLNTVPHNSTGKMKISLILPLEHMADVHPSCHLSE